MRACFYLINTDLSIFLKELYFFHPPNLAECPVLSSFKHTATEACFLEVSHNTLDSLVTSLWELVCYLPLL